MEMRSYLVCALERALRPLVRLLIRAGIRFDEFAHLARGVYVESAIRDGTGVPGIPSRARIAATVGITRRDVDSYIDNEGALPLAVATLAVLATEVLKKWHSTPEYVGPYGIPRELEFDNPADRCIRSLVALVMPDADPHVVVDELLHTGAVVVTSGHHFRAVSRSFMMPDPASPQVIEHVGRTLSRLGATLEFNMDSRHLEKRLERRVTAGRGLPPEVVPEFERYVRSRAGDFLVELDNWLAPYSSDETDGADRIDTGVNVFAYVEPIVTEEPLTSLISEANYPWTEQKSI
ncbi:MAG TPA: DUF6502 family protein [Steroidobacteraceae bacterium]|nr:DUF6502 family protein [Steroidobacteraceae bacterium]